MSEPTLDFWSFVDAAVSAVSRRQPVDTSAMRVVLSLYRTTNLVVYDLESSVHRPHGWSWPGFRLMFVLWVAGPLEGRRAAELSGMSRAAVSALATTLEGQGLLLRERGVDDRRQVRLHLTAEGERRLAVAFTAHNERERLWAGALSSAEQRQLVNLLRKLLEHRPQSPLRRRA